MSTGEKASPYPLLGLIIFCLIVLTFSVSQIINLASLNQKIIETNKILNLQSNQLQNIVAQPNQNYKTIMKTLSDKFPNEPEITTKFGITPDIAKLPLTEQIPLISQRIQENTQTQKEYPTSLMSQTWFWVSSISGWIALTILGRILTQLTDRIYKQRIEPWFDKHCSLMKKN